MRALGFDISTSAGWAVVDNTVGMANLKLVDRGLALKEKSALEYGPYPIGYRRAAKAQADKLVDLVRTWKPDVIVVEETNPGRSSFSQKLLEWIHLYFLLAWEDGRLSCQEPIYLRTGVWRHALGLKKDLVAKQNDLLLKKAKALAATGQITLNAAKKKLGVRGKWNKKMLAVDLVNRQFGLELKLKDNDVAEAICLCLAYFAGAPSCDGDTKKKRG